MSSNARASGDRKRGHFVCLSAHNALTVLDNGTMSVNQSQIPTLVYTLIRLSRYVNTLLSRRYGSLFALKATTHSSLLNSPQNAVTH